MPVIYIAFGTNLGERMANLRRALECLPPQVTVRRVSPVYETPPWGYTDQPAFLNMVAEAETELAPLELLAHLKAVETQVGRTPTFRYGPRQIDLDLLFYADLVSEQPGLQIPHPRLAARAFVLAPLADLAPELVHPTRQETIRELLAQVSTEGIVRYADQP